MGTNKSFQSPGFNFKYTWQFTTFSNSGSRGSGTLVWPPRTLWCMWYTDLHASKISIHIKIVLESWGLFITLINLFQIAFAVCLPLLYFQEFLLHPDWNRCWLTCAPCTLKPPFCSLDPVLAIPAILGFPVLYCTWFYVTPWLSHSLCWFGQSTHSDNWRFVPWKSEHWKHWGQVDEAYWLYSYFQWIWLRHVNSVSNCHFCSGNEDSNKILCSDSLWGVSSCFWHALIIPRNSCSPVSPVSANLGTCSYAVWIFFPWVRFVELETGISKTGIPSLFQWVSHTLKQNTVVTHLNPVLFLLPMCYWPKCGSGLRQSHQCSLGTKPAEFIFSYPWTCG